MVADGARGHRGPRAAPRAAAQHAPSALLTAALVAAALAPPVRAEGTLATHAFHSAVLGREWTCVVYQPGAPDAGGAPLPVLYLLHGYGGSGSDWANAGDVARTADSLIAGGHVRPFLIVMPDGGNGWWADGPERIATAFVEDLIPHVERTWRADPRRAARVIGGLSMGGYGALRFALLHPRTFGAALLLSPAIYDPVPPPTSGARREAVFGGAGFDEAVWRAMNWPALWPAYRATGVPVPLRIVAGDDDPFRLEREAARLYARCRDDGMPAELRIVDGGHDWNVWSRALADGLPWLFAAAGRGGPR